VHLLEVAPFGFRTLLLQLLEFSLQWCVTGPSIGSDLGCLGNGFVHELSQMFCVCTGYDLAVQPAYSLALALNGEHHQAFLLVAAATRAFLPAHESLIHLHHTVQRMFPAGLHGDHHFALEAPTGFLAQFQFAAQLRAGTALFVTGQVVHDPEGIENGELHLVEERIGRWRLGVPAAGALSVMNSPTLTVMIVAALGAFEPALPFHVAHVDHAGIVVREQSLKVEDRQAFVL